MISHLLFVSISPLIGTQFATQMNGQTQSGTLRIYLTRIVTFIWERARYRGFCAEKYSHT